MKEEVRTEQRKKKLAEKMRRKQEKAVADGDAAGNGAGDEDNKNKEGDDIDSDSSLNLSSESEDSDKMADQDADALNAKFVTKDPKVRTDVRNLRQREDTAKYLRNLDPTSAAYDGKSRIMKENPTPNIPENE